MTDAEELYTEGAEPRLVIRLSRTAAGVRTYTVGASMPLTPDKDTDTLARLFLLDELVRGMLDSEPDTRRKRPMPVDARVAPSRTEGLAEKMAALPAIGVGAVPEKGKHAGAGPWYTTVELEKALGVNRSTLRGRLIDAVREGTVEYERGTGRSRPSRYRALVPVTVEPGTGKVQKARKAK